MYSPFDVSRIDRQIDELQRLKATYQNPPQQPINNFITTPQQPTIPQQLTPIFEAKFTTENPADVLIQHKTAFIDLKNGKLSIKEVDGEMKEYKLILPKDEKDMRIEELEAKINKLESSYNNLLYKQTAINNPQPMEQTLVPTQDIVIPQTIIEASDINSTDIKDVTDSQSKLFKKGLFKQK